MAVKLNTKYLAPFVAEHELEAIAPLVEAADKTLAGRKGPGSDFLGWIDLPVDYDKEEFARIKAAAERIRKSSEVLIVIGIGGSYLGARAVIEALRSSMYNSLNTDTPDIYYIGNTINPAALNDVLKVCEGKDISVNVISKSGTTTEPALAFRIFKKLVEEKYGKEGAKKRIYAEIDKYQVDFDDNGDISGDVRVKAFRPYLGLGWGRQVPKTHRLGFRVELGCQFMGKMKVYQNDKEVNINDLGKKGDDDLSDFIDKVRIYPVVKFSLTGRIL